MLWITYVSLEYKPVDNFLLCQPTKRHLSETGPIHGVCQVYKSASLSLSAISHSARTTPLLVPGHAAFSSIPFAQSTHAAFFPSYNSALMS